MKLFLLKKNILIFMLLFFYGCGNYQLPDQKNRYSLHFGAHTSKISKKNNKIMDKSIIVVQGDSLYKISKRENIPLKSLILGNRIKAPYIIYPGQKLRLPIQQLYIVKKNENIYGIATKFHINPRALVQKNDLKPPYHLQTGERLRIPTVKDFNNKKVKKVTISKVSVKTPLNTADKNNSKFQNKKFSSKIDKLSKSLSIKFQWPIKGPIIIGFGPRKGGLHNDGINIAAPAGTKIRAAENGVVVYSGNQLRGFGNLALIRHKNGWMTAYAHALLLNVKRGDTVRRGQVIGKVGRTGSVAKPQLHFELRRNNKPQDPRKYITPRISLSKLLRKVNTLLSSNFLYKLPRHSS